MLIKEIALSSLKPAVYNPRKELNKSDEEYNNLKNSIQNFGYVEPIIVNKDMTVIGGHQRLTVLKDLGFKVGMCVVLDVDKNKEKALNITLNKISGFWDNDKLATLIEELNKIDMAEMTGFSKDEIDDFLKDMNIDDFYNSEDVENSKKENLKDCPCCGTVIDVKEWKIKE